VIVFGLFEWKESVQLVLSFVNICIAVGDGRVGISIRGLAPPHVHVNLQPYPFLLQAVSLL